MRSTMRSSFRHNAAFTLIELAVVLLVITVLVSGLAMPMAAQALTLYRLLHAGGHGDLDASAVVTLYPRGS